MQEYKKVQEVKETNVISMITKDILKSVSILKMYINDLNNRNNNSIENKVYVVYMHWESLSPFYLWSIPWFHELLDMQSNDSSAKAKKDFAWINKDTELQMIIKHATNEIENQYNIPSNI